jgi:hypothetical protein
MGVSLPLLLAWLALLLAFFQLLVVLNGMRLGEEALRVSSGPGIGWFNRGEEAI